MIRIISLHFTQQLHQINQRGRFNMGTTATLERMFWFDDQVRRKRYPNATKLAERFEISTKTAQRCIEAMGNRFYAPLQYISTEKGYIYTDNSFNLPHFQISQEEILSILLARSLLSKTAGGAISRAMGRFIRKLLIEAGKLGVEAGRMDQLFSAAWTGHAPAPPETFRQVAQSLLISRRLSFTYCSPGNNQATERTVEPHHLQYYMASWVLTAHCLVRNEWRKFYLSRMDSVRLREEPFTPKPPREWKNMVDRAFGIFQGKEPVRVVLHFSPFRARWIKEQLWHPDQETVELGDGGLELRLPVADFREIKMKILQFGADVTVIAPEELKGEIQAEIRAMTRLYPAG